MKRPVYKTLKSLTPHRTPRSAQAFDRFATVVISVVGVSVVLVVLALFAFLVFTVAPLFRSPQLAQDNAVVGGTHNAGPAPSRATYFNDENPVFMQVKQGPHDCVAEVFVSQDPQNPKSSWEKIGEFLPTASKDHAYHNSSLKCVVVGANRILQLAEGHALWEGSNLSNPSQRFLPAGGTLYSLDLKAQYLRDIDIPDHLSQDELRTLTTRTLLVKPAADSTQASSTQGRPSERLPYIYFRASNRSPVTILLPQFSPLLKIQGPSDAPHALPFAHLWQALEADPQTPVNLHWPEPTAAVLGWARQQAAYLHIRPANPLRPVGLAQVLPLPTPLAPQNTWRVRAWTPLGPQGVLAWESDSAAGSRVSFWRLDDAASSPSHLTPGRPKGTAPKPSHPTTQPEDTRWSHQYSAKLKELGPMRAWVPLFGLHAWLIEDDQGNCAVFDIERLGREALHQSSLRNIWPYLWRKPCVSPSNNQVLPNPDPIWIAAPHTRVAMRWQGTADSHARFALWNTSGGHELFSTQALPRGLSQSLPVGFSNQGRHILFYNTSDDSTLIQPIIGEHLDFTFTDLFSKKHYESYDAPSITWQSTSASDTFEPKLSFWPLILGTIKATLYAMLFAAPCGIFAAVYSSEILDRKARNIVKPSVEMMASIPSVVLGYLAALVIAPWIEHHVLSVLIIALCFPCSLYGLGHLSHRFSSSHIKLRGLYASRRLLLSMILGSLLSVFILLRLGRWIEDTAFGGDLKIYLSGGPGSSAVFWGILLMPLFFVLLWSVPWSKRSKSFLAPAVFLLAPALAFLAGTGVAEWGARGHDLFDSYTQRNTLVVAIAMGFTIIPIIFSIGEDALAAVPAGLRAASLACGASVWQTTARVVLPTAASGLFSAIMVGFGRGVGETMIVVMASGNTASLSFNPFEGLRSLSANIAVELPEAAWGSTHYRVLYVSALALFAFTFCLNSLAEYLRSRVRERNKAL